jgi:hypothetical protein
MLHQETVKKYLKLLNTGSVADEKALNEAYNDIFNRNTADDELEREHASKIYKMLLCCQESLSMDIITKALAFNEDGSVDREVNPVYIRQLTQDFIIETKQETLEFAHVSVRDYLQGEHRSDYNDAKCHAQMAQTSLRYIFSQNSAAYEVEMQSNTLLWYSHNFWGEHCAQLSKEDRQSLGVSVLLLNWLVNGEGSMTFQDWRHTIPKFSIYFRGYLIEDVSSPIFAACIWNIMEIAEELLAKDQRYTDKAEADSKDSSGRTPLSYAASGGHEAAVKLLLDTGADMDSKDSTGRTPLSWAAARGHEAVAKLLKEAQQPLS